MGLLRSGNPVMVSLNYGSSKKWEPCDGLPELWVFQEVGTLRRSP